MAMIAMNSKDFEIEVEEQKWTFAKTYAKKSPHEYFLRTDNPDLFWELKRRIAEKPTEITYFQTKFQCYIHKGKRYWGYDLVMNRCDNSQDYSKKKNPQRKLQ